MPDPITFDTTINPNYEDQLTQRLIAYNKSRAPLWEQNYNDAFKSSPIHIFLLDGEGRVIGGLIGRTHYLRCWLEVTVLWVDEDRRGLGLASELMRRAEVEATRRGCLYARVSTSDYQAPGFYEKAGYTLYGRLENCPPGDTVFYYRKVFSHPLVPPSLIGMKEGGQVKLRFTEGG